MGPSVLIVSEELRFLVECYAGLHRDKRIGRIEATTSQDEALALMQSLHPDAVVFDSSAGGSFGVSSIGRLCEMSPGLTVVVTFRERERQAIELTAHSSGARGIYSRDSFSAEALLGAMGLRSAQSVVALA